MRLLPLLGLLGGTCTETSGRATLQLTPQNVRTPLGSIVTLDVFVSSPDNAIQAFDFDVQSSQPTVFPFEVQPHTDFDDDGKLFRAPTIDLEQGLATGAADLRHGNAATGSFVRIATIRLYAARPGTTTVNVTRLGLATPAGALISASSYGTTITVTPP